MNTHSTPTVSEDQEVTMHVFATHTPAGNIETIDALSWTGGRQKGVLTLTEAARTVIATNSAELFKGFPHLVIDDQTTGAELRWHCATIDLAAEAVAESIRFQADRGERWATLQQLEAAMHAIAPPIVARYSATDADYYVYADEGPTCSICDGLGHGYPGGGPCPLEEGMSEADYEREVIEDQSVGYWQAQADR